MCRRGWIAAMLLAMMWAAQTGAQEVRPIGIARIDISPTHPVRLCGYAARTKESEGVEQKLWAKALAIGEGDKLSVLLTVDNTSVPAWVTEEVFDQLKIKAGLARERFAVCSSHTHSSPCLENGIRNMFGKALSEEENANIRKYTRTLIGQMEKVVLDAIADRKPGKLAWGQGTTDFAANRRTKGGPVDHSLPVLRITDEAGKVRAVLVNYACHCTTLGHEMNKACGDWAGYAQEYFELEHPETVAMVAIGCGADANPNPRGSLVLTKQHGRSVAEGMKQVLKGELKPLKGELVAKTKMIRLPFDKLPTKEQWEETAKRTDAIGYNAKLWVERLNRGEKLPENIPYLVQAWMLGDDLAMVFLPGEVVVDYSLRLKREFDQNRIWINAYANDVPCYIPSRRILAEGGYEAEGAMTYYGQPGRLAPAVENLIVEAVHEIVPVGFRSEKSKAEFPPAKTPQEALAAFQVNEGLTVALVASEPLVESPIAIDWGGDGKLWVVEMRDFPTGKYEDGRPGGVIKVLEDTDGDGKYDKPTVFLDGLPYPTGVMAWRKGATICAAPDIIYAEDTDGDGKADVKQVWCSGFSPENQQWEVNGFAYGLDNWVYGASSVSNAPIRVSKTGKSIDIGHRDFRMRPDTGEFEAASGRTQFSRVRDDFDNWFGTENGALLWHYPMAEPYVSRNPHLVLPAMRVSVPQEINADMLYPISRMLERFNDPERAHRVTSACGTGIYRDVMLGEEYYGNAFVCEPVHNLVRRIVMKSRGVTFAGNRAKGEELRDFLASQDNWFRPVQARTGPDGALWIVDMYRFVVEHPRWIRPERLARIDVRAGADKGRIYRVVRQGAELRAVPKLRSMSGRQLGTQFLTPNGTVRDMAQQELMWRHDQSAKDVLATCIASSGEAAAARVQALWTLEGLHSLDKELLQAALSDADARVKRQALRIAERRLGGDGELAEHVLGLLGDSDVTVRYQLALTLGQWNDLRATTALVALAGADGKDPWMRAAIVSASPGRALEILERLLKLGIENDALFTQLVATEADTADARRMATMMGLVAGADGSFKAWQLTALASMATAMERKGLSLSSLQEHRKQVVEEISGIFAAARKVAADPESIEPLRLAAVKVLGVAARENAGELEVLKSLLGAQHRTRVQEAAVMALVRVEGGPQVVLKQWAGLSPTVRLAATEMLVGRAQSAKMLLDAIEGGRIAASDVGPAQRRRLVENPDSDVRQRAATVLGAGGSADRAQVLKQYESAASLKGEPARGAEIFTRSCASCHALGGQGHEVGPSLAALTDRSAPALLLAIVDPNAAVEWKFAYYDIELEDGSSVAGIIAGETDGSVTILGANSLKQKISRRDIKRVRSSKMSMMPEGLEQGLSPQDMADLISFVQAQKG